MKIVFDLFSEYTNTPTDPQIQKHIHDTYTNTQIHKIQVNLQESSGKIWNKIYFLCVKK